jgi:hypothetical protein
LHPAKFRSYTAFKEIAEMDNSETLRTIRFSSFNPYEVRYPGLRVVPRATLHLIKMLRERGFSTVVEPENGTRLNYFAEKGLREILSDPVVLFAISIPVNILTGVISAWMRDVLKGRDEPPEVNVVIEVDRNGNKIRYNHRGEQISEERSQMPETLLDARAKGYAASLQAVSPDPAYPTPIHLEHTGKVVAWAESPHLDDKGIRFNRIDVFDAETWARIQNGELKGLSIAGIIRRSTCTVCDNDYTECNHIAGQLIKDRKCAVRIEDFLLAECSIVREPIQPLARLKLRHLNTN